MYTYAVPRVYIPSVSAPPGAGDAVSDPADGGHQRCQGLALLRRRER